jgi:hypothetical protein
MAKPFISYTSYRTNRMRWLKELLYSLGFDEPIVVENADPHPPLDRVLDELNRADCLFALISPERRSNGETVDASRPASWIQDELAVASSRGLPIGAICEPTINISGMSRSAFTWQTVDFDDPETLLSATPAIIKLALKIKNFVDQAPEQDYPFVYDKVHIIDSLSEDAWRELRVVSITARKLIRSTEHSVDVGMDQTPGISVKLSNPERDLRVTCKERPDISIELTKNDESEVAYRINFDPPLLAGDTVQYRHNSSHPNIFPLTSTEVRQRAQLPQSPPYMKEGLIGNTFDVTRPIKELILEVEAPIELGLATPEVKVYATRTTEEVEGETHRIANPKLAPRLWHVISDEARGIWTCRVSIPTPIMGQTYCLLVRPTLSRLQS